MIVSGLVGLSKEDVVRHVEGAFRNGRDIKFKKNCHVMVIQNAKLVVTYNLVLLIVSGLVGLSKENALNHVEVAFRNGPDINFKKVKMKEDLVVEMLL